LRNLPQLTQVNAGSSGTVDNAVIGNGNPLTGELTMTATRKIVHIDENKCNGCGECVPSCAEGAIQVIDGKARLVGENLCDGLGNCLGTCPLGAITIEERPAEAFDELAVRERQAQLAAPAEPAAEGDRLPCGCPGTMMRKLAPSGEAPAPPAAPETGGRSQLRHWPVQLTLLPEQGDIWHDADVLLSADCVPCALGDFHDRLLAGRTLAVACPKLDDAAAYVEKLARILAGNAIRSVTIARMEVPCCGGLVRIMQTARARANSRVPVSVVTVAASGEVVDVSEMKAAG